MLKHLFLLVTSLGLTLASALATDAPQPPQTTPVQVPDTLAQRLKVCYACHGKDGRASSAGYLPRIAGKPAAYLYHQLRNFHEGRRGNQAMRQLVAQLPDAYLREIALHFAGLDLPYAVPTAQTVAPSLLARGEALARQGDKALGLPACSACHGERLTGVLPAIPGLLGLPRDYLVGELGAWRNGERQALAPDCMAHVVERLGQGDVVAVAAWLSTQPVPANPHAAPAGSAGPAVPDDLRCGSQREEGLP